jgi:Fe-S-cluster containining protein
MLESKEINHFDCQRCGCCCKKGQSIELSIREAERLGKSTKIRIDIRQTLENNTLLWRGVVCELLEDCGNLTDLPDGRVACEIHDTSGIPVACKVSQPGQDFCLDAVEYQKNLQKFKILDFDKN